MPPKYGEIRPLAGRKAGKDARIKARGRVIPGFVRQMRRTRRRAPLPFQGKRKYFSEL
jgi:hypothetical protein